MSTPGLGELILLALLTMLPLLAIVYMVLRLAVGRSAMQAAPVEPDSGRDRTIKVPPTVKFAPTDLTGMHLPG